MSGLTRRSTAAMLFAAAVVAVLLSLTRLVWSELPAIPIAHIPATSLTLSDLDRLSGIASLPLLSTAFYQWLAWTLVATAFGATVVALARPGRVTRAAGVAVALLCLLITIAALKAAVSWHDYWANSSQVRAGTILYELFFVMCAIACRLTPLPTRIAESAERRHRMHLPRHVRSV